MVLYSNSNHDYHDHHYRDHYHHYYHFHTYHLHHDAVEDDNDSHFLTPTSWDSRDPPSQPVASVEGHSAPINCVSFNPFDEVYCLTGSSDSVCFDISKLF